MPMNLVKQLKVGGQMLVAVGPLNISKTQMLKQVTKLNDKNEIKVVNISHVKWCGMQTPQEQCGYNYDEELHDKTNLVNRAMFRMTNTLFNITDFKDCMQSWEGMSNFNEPGPLPYVEDD